MVSETEDPLSIPAVCAKVKKNARLARATARRISYLLRRDEDVLKFRSKYGRAPNKEEMDRLHYNISVQLDGRTSLLVDTGSPTNIAGEKWLLKAHAVAT